MDVNIMTNNSLNVTDILLANDDEFNLILPNLGLQMSESLHLFVIRLFGTSMKLIFLEQNIQYFCI